MNLIENALLESMRMNQFLATIHENFDFIDILADIKPQKGEVSNVRD